ncbi:MAG: AraC family transcriptional regulator [Polyangiaceae bacterium]
MPSATFEAEALADPDGRVPSSLLLQLWEYLPSRCPDESFGFWLAEQLQAPPLSLATWVISSSPTLGHGFERALRYQRLLHDEAQSELHCNDAEVAYRHQIGRPPFRAPNAAIEFGFVSFLQLARRLTGRVIVPQRLQLRHPAPRDATRHAAFFGPGLAFSAEVDELVLDRASLELPVLDADPTLARIVEGHAEAALARLPASNALGARVRAQINELLKEGTPSIEAVCARLHLSRRTLQRQLSAAGTSFGDELDQARHQLALRYLADTRVSLQETAFLLGFSEASAFHRAFVRWTGQTPANFRRKTG